MKKSLLFILFIVFTINLQAQKDTANVIAPSLQKNISREASVVNINIYPVPVRENNFTIKCDREVAFVKITNMIGQDIFRTQYRDPQLITKVILDNPKRGIYLVTIIFKDGVRVVKKIMIEESE